MAACKRPAAMVSTRHRKTRSVTGIEASKGIRKRYPIHVGAGAAGVTNPSLKEELYNSQVGFSIFAIVSIPCFRKSKANPLGARRAKFAKEAGDSW